MSSKVLSSRDNCRRFLLNKYQKNHAERLWNYLDDFYELLETGELEINLKDEEEAKQTLRKHVREGMSQEVNRFSVRAYRVLLEFLMQEYPEEKEKLEEIHSYIAPSNFPEITSKNQINETAEEKAEKYRKKVISKEALEKAFQKADEHQELILRGLYDTGCRSGEFVAIKRRDLNFTDSRAPVVIQLRRSWTQNSGLQDTLKFSDSREVIGGEDFAELLKQHLKDSEIEADDFLFYPQLKRITVKREKIPQIIDDVFSDIDTQIDNITAHNFRHSRATQLVNQNKNYFSISEYLGHSSLDNTKVYTHIDKQVPQHIAQVEESGESEEGGPLDKLEKLRDLHERGAVSDDEFEAKKAELLERV